MAISLNERLLYGLALIFLVFGGLLASGWRIDLGFGGSVSSDWAPPNTKAGSEQRALYNGGVYLPSAFIDPAHGFPWNNTSAVCTQGTVWRCKITSGQGGAIAYLNVDAAGNVTAG